MHKLSIAIDGPAGAGKSSVAKALANELSYLYIDTGAMYRAVTWAALEKEIIDNKQEIIAMLESLDLVMQPTKEAFEISVWGRSITYEIRTQKVTSNVSAVAAIKEVREYLVALQREMAKKGGIILDGRDIGSVVLPDADIKFYLTASVKTRAYRRWLEIKGTPKEIPLQDVEESVIKRDHLDMTREESPLVCVDDAIVIDSSDLDFNETINEMKRYIEEKK